MDFSKMKFFFVSLFFASLHADMPNEISLIMKNEENFTPLAAKEAISRFIDQKCNIQNERIAGLLKQQNEDLTSKLSHMISPVSTHVESMKDELASVGTLLREFEAKNENIKTQTNLVADRRSEEKTAQGQNAQGCAANTEASFSKSYRLSEYREPIKHSGFNLFVDYLLWKPVEDNLEYCIVDQQRSSATDPASTPALLAQDMNGDFKFATLDISSGVRVGAGYMLPYDTMGMQASYTYFYSNGNHSAQKPNNANLYLRGTFRENTGNPVQEAKTSINLKLNEVDFSMISRLRPTDQTLLSLFMGAMGAWFSQDWDITYTGTTGLVNHIDQDWTFSGGGPRLGMNLDWHLGSGFSLYALFSGALVVGNYEFTYYAKNPSHSAYPTGDAKYEETRMVPNLQLITGLSYGQFYRSWGYQLIVGYEANSWLNVFRLPVASYTSYDAEMYDFYRDGNITLQGLTARFAFMF